MPKINIKNPKINIQLEGIKRECLVDETLSQNPTCDSYNPKVLERLIKHLSKQKKKKSNKKFCPIEDHYEGRVDNQVKLKCRQLPNVILELRKAIMRQNWDEVTTLLTLLCHPGLKYYTTIIIRVCFLLIFNHPKSNLQILQNFIRFTTGYVLEEDVNKFLRVLFTLRKTPLGPLVSGKYVRKTGDYKVVRDPEFSEL